ALLAFAVAAPLVRAVSLVDVPECALPCLDDAVKKVTRCSTTDNVCICDNLESIRASAAGCILQGCGQDATLSKVLP
ncbi:hypothetical protein B0H19DRAFT_844751, partial [Mycena capillaripes]